jgi:hypothetical protein
LVPSGEEDAEIERGESAADLQSDPAVAPGDEGDA